MTRGYNTLIENKEKYFLFHSKDMQSIFQFKVKVGCSYGPVSQDTDLVCYLLLMTLVRTILFNISQVYAYDLQQPKSDNFSLSSCHIGSQLKENSTATAQSLE